MRIQLTAVSLVLSLASTGCVLAVAAVAGAAVFGAVKYTENGIERDFRQDLAQCFDAAKATMREAGHAIAADAQPGPTEGTLTSGDTVIRLTRQAGPTASSDDDFTRIAVKVGTFDSEETKRQATLLMDAIVRRLGE
jgi:hypothetical protein